jgi:hypothetical protein
VCPFLPSQANGKLQSAVSDVPINETRRSTFAIRTGNESDPEAGRGHQKQPLQQCVASKRQFNVTPASHEELGTKLVLQSFNALAKRRLRNVQQRCCSPKMKSLCDGSKIAEPDQIHV